MNPTMGHSIHVIIVLGHPDQDQIIIRTNLIHKLLKAGKVSVDQEETINNLRHFQE